MELQVDLVVQHVLAQRTTVHGLDRVLSHHVHSETVQVRVGEFAVRALVQLLRCAGTGGNEDIGVNGVVLQKKPSQICNCSQCTAP